MNSGKLQLTQGNLRAILEHGSEMEGELQFTGIVRLNGRLKGDVNSADVLIVGETAEIRGNLNVGEIVIGGRINGIVKARNRVEILASGAVFGSIEAPVLVTHEGAQIMGEVRISHATPRAP